MPVNVMTDESEIREFLNKIKGDVRFRDAGLVRVLDSTRELETIKNFFAKIPNTGGLFYPAPIVAIMKGGAICPFFGENIEVSIGGVSTPAWQVHNSNLCIVCYQNEKKQFILHEMIHYLHWRASGYKITFNKNGRPVEIPMPPWIFEGFPALIYYNSLHQFTKEQYTDYTKLLILLEGITQNERITKESFLFGDLRKIQQIVDEKLGEHTFERMLAKANSSNHGGAMEALDFLLITHQKTIQRKLESLKEKLDKNAATLQLLERELNQADPSTESTTPSSK
jgi:hypothetical protein